MEGLKSVHLVLLEFNKELLDAQQFHVSIATLTDLISAGVSVAQPPVVQTRPHFILPLGFLMKMDVCCSFSFCLWKLAFGMDVPNQCMAPYFYVLHEVLCWGHQNTELT